MLSRNKISIFASVLFLLLPVILQGAYTRNSTDTFSNKDLTSEVEIASYTATEDMLVWICVQLGDTGKLMNTAGANTVRVRPTYSQAITGPPLISAIEVNTIAYSSKARVFFNFPTPVFLQSGQAIKVSAYSSNGSDSDVNGFFHLIDAQQGNVSQVGSGIYCENVNLYGINGSLASGFVSSGHIKATVRKYGTTDANCLLNANDLPFMALGDINDTHYEGKVSAGGYLQVDVVSVGNNTPATTTATAQAVWADANGVAVIADANTAAIKSSDVQGEWATVVLEIASMFLDSQGGIP
jgi:hypothetical protein